MAIWDKLREELDDAARATQEALQKAGKAAQEAIDEGKLRLDAYHARQESDRAAQSYGYAVYRARKAGAELDAPTADKLYNTLAEKEAEAARLEGAASVVRNRGSEPPAAESTQEPPPPAA